MKKPVILLTALAAILTLAWACAADAPALPAPVQAEVQSLVAEGWIPADTAVSCAELDTCWEAQLTAPDGSPLAVLRVDRLNHRQMVYFRRADCTLPALPMEEAVAECGSDPMNAFTADAEGIIDVHQPPDTREYDWCGVQLLCSPEAGVGVYAAHFHGEIYTPLVILRQPEEGGSPTVLAYVDLITTRWSGYDGYLTAMQAREAADAAIRAAYGDEAADHAVPEDIYLVVCDYFCYFEDDACPGSAEGPFWSLILTDPRSDPDSLEYSLFFDTTPYEDEDGWIDESFYDENFMLPGEPVYAYYITLDAATGEVYRLRVEGFGRG